jgi:tripartite-type tricarboxylate transporter receptor subunit TctC
VEDLARNRTRRTRRWAAGGLVLTLALAACNDGGASGGEEVTDVAAYYKGKQVEAIIPFPPGGGTDVRMRYMADWYEKLLPGNPTIVPTNVDGGGGISGSNQWFQHEPDGTSVMMSSSGAVNLPLLFGNPNLRIDINKMVPTVAIPTGSAFYVSPDTGVRTAADLLHPAKPLVLAEQSPDGTGLRYLVAAKLLGIDLKVVFGYQGRGPARIAFEQGEANVNWDAESAWKADVQPLVDAGKAIPLFAVGQLDENGNVVRDEIFPDLPTVPEVYEQIHGKPAEGPILEAYKTLIAATNQFGTAVWVHQDAPPAIIQAWKDAAIAMNDDPKFWDEGGRKAVGSYDLVTGDAVTKAFEGVRNPNPEGREWLLNFLSEEHGLKYGKGRVVGRRRPAHPSGRSEDAEAVRGGDRHQEPERRRDPLRVRRHVR